MIINGIDTSRLGPMAPPDIWPEETVGRVAHIDADFLAYMCSYEKKDEHVSLKDMQSKCHNMVENFRRHAGASSVYLHLTPGTSDKGDRYNIAIQKEYQANRDGKEKPAQLHVLREWMGQHYAATLHQKCEADDGMSSSQYARLAAGDPESSVIISKDKDLCMVPGLHLDWDTHELIQSEDVLGHPSDYGSIHLDHSKSAKKIKGYGHKFFWAQMLMGDQADNIAGIPAVFVDGKPKKTGPVMADWVLTNVDSNKAAFDLVKTLFEQYGTRIGFKHWNTNEAVSWQQVFVSEAKLLWMRREKHDSNDVLKWFKEINQ